MVELDDSENGDRRFAASDLPVAPTFRDHCFHS